MPTGARSRATPSPPDLSEDERNDDTPEDAYRRGVYEALCWAARRSLHLRTHCLLAQASIHAREIRTARTPPPMRVLDAIAARLAEPDGPTTTRRNSSSARATPAPRRTRSPRRS